MKPIEKVIQRINKEILPVIWQVVISVHQQHNYSAIFSFQEVQHSFKNTVKVFPLPFWIVLVITCNLVKNGTGKCDILCVKKILLPDYRYLLLFEKS